MEWSQKCVGAMALPTLFRLRRRPRGHGSLSVGRMSSRGPHFRGSWQTVQVGWSAPLGCIYFTQLCCLPLWFVQTPIDPLMIPLTLAFALCPRSTGSNLSETEIFVVEGDSAGGSAKQARRLAMGGISCALSRCRISLIRGGSGFYLSLILVLGLKRSCGYIGPGDFIGCPSSPLSVGQRQKDSSGTPPEREDP